MPYQKISHNLKLAAMHMHDQEILSVADIIDCLNISRCTFCHILDLWRTTGNVVHYTNGVHGRLRLLHFNDINYLRQLSGLIQTGFLMNYWNCSKIISSSWLITQQYIGNLSMLTYWPRNWRKLLQSTMKTSMQTTFVIWLSVHQNNLAFWMKFRRMKEPLWGLEASPGQAPVLWRKVYLCVVITSLLKVFSPLMAWFPTLLLKDQWHMSVSFNTWNSLWSGWTCWIGSTYTHCFADKMPLYMLFPGYLSVLVMDNACIHHGERILELAAQFSLYHNPSYEYLIANLF